MSSTFFRIVKLTAVGDNRPIRVPQKRPEKDNPQRASRLFPALLGVATLSGAEPFRSRQQLLNDLSANVGEPEIAALEFEGELRVIKA